jgi:hypothetical protein
LAVQQDRHLGEVLAGDSAAMAHLSAESLRQALDASGDVRCAGLLVDRVLTSRIAAHE